MQTIAQNTSMMPNIDQDLLAVGQDQQFKILSQSDLNSCTKYGTTFLCKGCDVMGKKLEDTCLGAYYLEHLESFQTLFILFKICFTSDHSIKPLFPTYRTREWTRRRTQRNKRDYDGILKPMGNDKMEMQSLAQASAPSTQENKSEKKDLYKMNL